MKIFILIVLIVIALVYYIGKNKSKKPAGQRPKTVSSPKPPISKPIKTEENLLYKKKGIKVFDMKGMFYQNLNPEKDKGEFIGFAKCESNSHDMYAVGIYNAQNKLLGYTPKGNKRLNSSLTEWHKGETITWGNLRHDDYDDRWYGTAYIPVGFTSDELEKIKRVLSLKQENENQIGLKEKETSKYFEILNRHQEITKLIAELKNPEELYYSVPKNLIPSISSHLEKEKNWEKLIELEEHQDLINELNDKFKETTLKRISNAKKKVA